VPSDEANPDAETIETPDNPVEDEEVAEPPKGRLRLFDRLRRRRPEG